MTIWNARRVRSGHIQRKIYFIIAIQENLRIFLNCFFTDGVVEGISIYSAAFCESAALRRKLLPTFSRLNPLRRGSGLRGFAVPFGEVGKADRL